MAECSDNSSEKLSNKEIKQYLKKVESESNDRKKLYALNADSKHPLHGCFFKAKTVEGAILKIYMCMIYDEVPHCLGANKGLLIEKVTDIFYEEPKSFKDLSRICTNLFLDFGTCFDRIIVYKPYRY